MKNEYLNIYNNLIKLTRNKLLFEKITNKDSFSHRLMVFLFHFAFFLKIYNLDDMNDYKFVEKATQKDFSQNSFVYGVLSSLRDKINAPVRKRKEK